MLNKKNNTDSSLVRIVFLILQWCLYAAFAQPPNRTTIQQFSSPAQQFSSLTPLPNHSAA